MRKRRLARRRWWARKILQDWHSRPPTHSGIDYAGPGR
jgi:hypothetical protein